MKTLIAFRTHDGWSNRMPFDIDRAEPTCPFEGALLFLNPGGDPYCDQVHPNIANATSLKQPPKTAADDRAARGLCLSCGGETGHAKHCPLVRAAYGK